MRRSFTTLVMAGLGTPLIAACDDGTTEPEPLSEIEVMVLADQAMSDADEDVGHARAPGVPGLFFPARVNRVGIGDTPDCPQDGFTYVCTHDGLGRTRTIEITFFDGSGPMEAYDESDTESIHFLSTAEGSVDLDRFSGSMSRTRDLTVSGLSGEETTRTWNGTTEGTSSRVHAFGDFAGEEITTTSSSTIEDLTLPLPEDETAPWPLGGVITTEMSRSGGPRAGEYLIVITFDGTQFASVLVNGEEMTVDLAARRDGRHHGLSKPRHHGGP